MDRARSRASQRRTRRPRPVTSRRAAEQLEPIDPITLVPDTTRKVAVSSREVDLEAGLQRRRERARKDGLAASSWAGSETA